MNNEQVLNMLINLKEFVFPHDIWNVNNCEKLIENSVTVKGVILCIFIIFMIILASHIDYSYSQPIRILAVVAFVNVLDGTYFILRDRIFNVFFHSDVGLIETTITGVFNPFSILIVCILLTEYYNYKVDSIIIIPAWKAFFFGISAFGMTAVFEDIQMWSMNDTSATAYYWYTYFIVRTLLAGVVCFLCSKLKRGYIIYILFSSFFIFSEAVKIGLLFQDCYNNILKSIDAALRSLAEYKAEYIVIACIAFLWFLFDVVLIRKKGIQQETEMLKIFNLGKHYDKKSNYQLAERWYKRAAEQGHADAQFRLGILYDWGFPGIEQNKLKASRCFMMAAEQGHADAQIKLGVLYEFEKDMMDFNKAFVWYQKAAEQGNGFAQYKLGQMFEQGKGRKADKETALECYKKASKRKCKLAKKQARKLKQQMKQDSKNKGEF